MPLPEPTKLPAGVSYVIATTVRTGSYLLCEALTATAVAGRPSETLNIRHRQAYLREWGLPAETSSADFLAALKQKGSTPNGVFGVKVHGHHVGPLAEELGFVGMPHDVLRELFPKARYIYLYRRDRRAQAISYHRATATNEWWRIKGVVNPHANGKEVAFDAREILRLEGVLKEQEEAWLHYFAKNEIEPLTMDYEALCADYRGEVARALAFLDEDTALASDLPEPRLVRQSDALTLEWRQRMDAKFPQAEIVTARVPSPKGGSPSRTGFQAQLL